MDKTSYCDYLHGDRDTDIVLWLYDTQKKKLLTRTIPKPRANVYSPLFTHADSFDYDSAICGRLHVERGIMTVSEIGHNDKPVSYAERKRLFDKLCRKFDKCFVVKYDRYGTFEF